MAKMEIRKARRRIFDPERSIQIISGDFYEAPEGWFQKYGKDMEVVTRLPDKRTGYQLHKVTDWSPEAMAGATKEKEPEGDAAPAGGDEGKETPPAGGAGAKPGAKKAAPKKKAAPRKKPAPKK